MWAKIFEGDALSKEATEYIYKYDLYLHPAQGWGPGENTPEEIRTFNFDGRINDRDYDHLLLVDIWVDD